MRVLFVLFFTYLYLFCPLAFALTPPLSPAQLQEEADLIVEGRVEAPIKCLGLLEKNNCSDKLKFSVPMKIVKLFKGKGRPGETIGILFYYYDYGKSHCVGDQAAILHSGDEGKYFLTKNSDGTYTPVHWSGAKVAKPGEGSLPTCP